MATFPVEIIDKDAYIAELEAEVERLDRETRLLAGLLLAARTPTDLLRDTSPGTPPHRAGGPKAELERL